MKVGYSEFSYGYAFTENLIRSLSPKLTGAPVFPNLVQEAKVGYDVKIELPAVPLFFQFKLPEKMQTDRAFEIAGGKCGSLKTPFYRISLMRHDISCQHANLIKLENSFPNCVFYAAPCLENIHTFNRSYGLLRMHKDTAFFSPKDIGQLPDNKQHTIAYRSDMAHAYFCSDPRKIRCTKFGEIREKTSALLKQEEYADANQVSRTILDKLIGLVSSTARRESAGLADRIRVRIREANPAAEINTEQEETLTNLLVAREVARIDLGLELLVAQPS